MILGFVTNSIIAIFQIQVQQQTFFSQKEMTVSVKNLVIQRHG